MFLIPASECIVVAFTGSDPDQTLHRSHPDLPVTDLAGPGHCDDRVDDPLDKLVVDHHVDAHLRHEVDRVLGPTVDLGVPALPAAALDFGDGKAQHSGV